MTARWRWAVGWVILTALVVAAALRLDWRQAGSALAAADPLLLGLALLANAAILPLATGQWLLLLPRGVRVPPARMFSIVALTASVSNGGPPLAGHAAGIRLLATRGGLGHPAAVSLTLLDQVAEGLAKLALVGAGVLLVPGFEFRAVGAVVLVGAPLLALAFVALAHRGDAAARLAGRAPRWAAAPARFLAEAVTHLDALRRPAAFGAVVALGIAQKGAEALGIAAVAAALGVDLPAWAVVAVLVAVNLSSLVSVTPAGLGVYEGAAFLVLRAAGVDPATAVAAAVAMHATYLLPLAASGWILESLRGWRGAPAPLLAALASLGIGIHAWFILGGDALDSDRAFVLLMARAFAQGEWSLYLWEQNYMGALEPLLLTPLAALGLATPVVAGCAALALTAGLGVLSAALARSLGADPWPTVLLWAVPPALVVHHHVSLYGARLAATLLCVAAFAWALRARSRPAWAGVGALLGVAWFGDHMMLPWAAAVMLVAAGRGGLGGLSAGALPLVAADTAAAVLTPAAHLAGPNAPGDWIWNVPRMVGVALPQLLGLLPSRGPTPAFETPAPLLPASLAWPALALPGAAALLALTVTLVRRRNEVFGAGAGERGLAARALALACLVALGLFAFVGGGGDTWTVRYLVPLWPALSILAALAVAGWPARLRPLAAAAVLPAVFTLAADPAWPRAGDSAPARAEADAVAEAVRRSGAAGAWAEYWDAYRMALLLEDEPPWFAYRGIERRPRGALGASGAGPAAYLVREGDAEALDALAGAGAQGIRTLSSERVGRYRLIVVERAFPLFGPAPPPASRAWQMLAAAAAGLLFAGTLAAAFALRWRARSAP